MSWTPQRDAPAAFDTTKQLAQALALRARRIREVAREQLDRDEPEARALARELGAVGPGRDPEQLADGYAQSVCYGLLVARWLTRADPRPFTRALALEGGAGPGAPLRGSLATLLVGAKHPTLIALLDELAELLRTAAVAELFAGVSDPSIHFYEQFLDAYDPSLRRRMGVYYTPDAIVEHMVDVLDGLARTRLGLRLGLADPIRWAAYAETQGVEIPAGVDDDAFVVQILDPATGTGTFVLRVVERIFATMRGEYDEQGLSDAEAGAAWTRYVREALIPRVFGYELLMAPYLVAQLRLGAALEAGLARDAGLDPAAWGLRFEADDRLGLRLGNCLAADPERSTSSSAISVVIGNPPFERVSGELDGSAEWLVHGEVPGRDDGRSLFDDLRDVAREHTRFSHLRSLSDRYVYFWRWAVWQVFERRTGPGLIGLISNSTWLSGPGFCGLRKLVREAADELEILDLGGDTSGPAPEPNVFGITTAVAIASLVRGPQPRSATPGLPAVPARARYRKIEGPSAAAKLAALAEPGRWTAPDDGWLDSLVPARGDADTVWRESPALAALFPWQQPGCLASRTWPIAPDPDTLERRWQRFVSAPVDERPELFATAKTGRNIETRVPGYAPLASLTAEAAAPERVRYSLRSFDRQWILADPRLLKTESPSLWRSASNRQLFLTTLMSARLGDGPALTLAAAVPDFHHFRGSYGGKDVIPLYRDAAAREPNITAGVREAIAAILAIELPSPEDLAAYVYALLSTPAYQRRFAAALATPGPRVPITRDPQRWAEAVTLGRELLWLHSYAERLREPEAGRGATLPILAGLEWRAPISAIPKHAGELRHDGDRRELTIGTGRLLGVAPELWAYSVSGMAVVKKWLGYRTASGSGRAKRSASALDGIRATAWPEAWTVELVELLAVLDRTLTLGRGQAALFEAICAGPRISATQLPRPSPAEREAPS